MNKTKRLQSQAGITLLEMLVVLIITSALLIMSYSMLDDAARTSLFVEVRNELPVQAQMANNVLQGELFQAETIFDSSASQQGLAYQAALKLPTAFPALTDSRMPLANATSGAALIADATSTSGPPPAPQYTGNCLLFVRQLAPVQIYTDAAKTPSLAVLIDRYQFEYFYLTKRNTRSFSNTGYYLDLMRGRSEIYADWSEVNAIPLPPSPNPTGDARRQTLVANLAAWIDPTTNIAMPVTRAWFAGQPVNNAFYDMSSTSPFLSTTPVSTASPMIDMSATTRGFMKNTVSVMPALSGGSTSGMVVYSVGFRPTASTQFPVADVIPKYAGFDSTKPNFPSGLEFLLVGAQGSRRLLSRVVVIANYGAGKMTSREVTNITSVK